MKNKFQSRLVAYIINLEHSFTLSILLNFWERYESKLHENLTFDII